MKWYITALLFIIFSGISNASINGKIEISSAKMSLVAPFSSEYQWYHNGKLIDGENNRVLKISKSGIYTVTLKNVYGISVQKSIGVRVTGNKIVKIYLIGDSTMQDYSIRSDYLTKYYPMTGWGETFQSFMMSDSLPKLANVFDVDSILIINKARGGRSTSVFWQEGAWKEVQDMLQPGDYVFIQFGHNDEASCTDYPDRCVSLDSFKIYLGWYIDSTRAKGAVPVLLTPINRDYPWSGGKLTNSHGLYPEYLKQTGHEKYVPVIDLTQRSLDLFNEKGQDYTTNNYFCVFPAGVYEAFPDGNNDRTHLQTEGAVEVSRLAFEGLQDLCEIRIDVSCDTCGKVDGNGWYEKKYTPVTTISAIPVKGWIFDSWSGDVSGNSNPLELIVDGNKSIVAHFTETLKNQYYLTTTVEGNGEVELSAFGGIYEEGQEIIVSATAVKDYKFYTWTGDVMDTSKSINVTMNHDLKINALFVESNATVFEAEDAALVNCEILATIDFYAGTGYAGIPEGTFSSITWTVLPQSERTFGIDFRYLNNTGVTLSGALYINDELIEDSLDFNPTVTENGWGKTTKLLKNLKNQKNRIRLEFNDPLAGINVDYLKLSGNTSFLDTNLTYVPTKTLELPEFCIYPNPVRSETVISFRLAEKSNVGIEFVNVSGQKVFQIDKREYLNGLHEIGMANISLTPGIYACFVNINGQTLQKKIVVY